MFDFTNHVSCRLESFYWYQLTWLNTMYIFISTYIYVYLYIHSYYLLYTYIPSNMKVSMNKRHVFHINCLAICCPKDLLDVSKVQPVPRASQLFAESCRKSCNRRETNSREDYFTPSPAAAAASSSSSSSSSISSIIININQQHHHDSVEGRMTPREIASFP